MIRIYGLYWATDKVSWGTLGRGNPGKLLGSKNRSDTENTVDFRDQRGIYALYSEFNLVYVGQTSHGNNRLLKRLKSHTFDHLSERWDRFSWFGIRWVTNNNTLAADANNVNVTITSALNIMEAVAIAISEPRLNLQRGNWSAANAEQYFQVSPNQSEYL